LVNISVVGCGQWGPNYIRIFSQFSQARVLACADLNSERLQAIKEAYPSIEIFTDYRKILENKDIQAVCIATPTVTHFSLVKAALEQGKHVLCEKPLAFHPKECLQLEKSASRYNKILMVGHIFLFNAGIIQLKEYLRSGELGRLYYAYSTRTNLGPFRYDVNALWDLASHDISIFNYLFDSCPKNVSARGQKCLGSHLEDLSFVTLEYPRNIMVNLHVSWLDPKKVRQITIVGDKKMMTWDDLDAQGPIKIYDKHVERSSVFYKTYGEFQLLSREGNITIPKVALEEPLRAEVKYFLDCIEKNNSPELVDARKGYDVVKTLAAIQASMNGRGKCVAVK